jgi:hypothetical protein
MMKHTILFLAGDPSGRDPSALGREARSIQEELERSGCRDCFVFETRWAIGPLDLLRELRRLKPTVVHLSGRVGRDGLFFFDSEPAQGRARPLVSVAALAETLGAVGAGVRLLVLDSCYIEDHAEVLTAHVDGVVVLGGTLSPDSAKTFAIGFYGGLGEGESIAAAHRQGCAAISLAGFADRDRPRLILRQRPGWTRKVEPPGV